MKDGRRGSSEVQGASGQLAQAVSPQDVKFLSTVVSNESGSFVACQSG